MSRTMPYRYIVSALLGVIAVTLGLTPLSKILDYIDLDVIGLIIGMSIMTVYIESSGLARLAALLIERRVRRPSIITFLLSLVAGVISIALENVTVVLIVAPIAFTIASKRGIDPRPLIIGVALASNLAGSATMIGDPQAIITAGYFKLSFGDFIVYNGKPSMFFFTLVAMILACLSLGMLSRKPSSQNTKSPSVSEEVDFDKAFIAETLIFLALKIALLTLRGRLGIPLTLAAVVAVGGLSITRLVHRDLNNVVKAFKDGFEWRVALFLIGVFILSGAFVEQGLANDLACILRTFSGGDLFILTSLLVWISVLASAFIDNIPYIATMLPVIDGIHKMLNVNAITLAWALLLGATLGGNLTYIGASANVIAMRMLEKHGFRTSFMDFIRFSIPFNTISVLSGWLLYEITWVLPS
ncbi:MAG TPA: citrate transporter [Acidilobales archaeon]|nr:citrate transporter [Acidilobales archaeon]